MKSLPAFFKKAFFAFFVFVFLLAVYVHSPFVFIHHSLCIKIKPAQKVAVLIDSVVPGYRPVDRFLFKGYLELSRLDKHLQVGEYCFLLHDSLINVLSKIAHADRNWHEFTIVEGWTSQQMLVRIQQEIPSIDLSLKEGEYYPETYFYTYPDTILSCLREAHQLMLLRLHDVFLTSESKLYFKTPEELLIAASIVQKEASDPIEQRLVAGVMINRLQKHMRLQMDATMLYALQGRDDAIPLSKALKMASPYNTYLHEGLPPTPICMPGQSALYAVAHPMASDYLYYVFNKGSGKHQFSKTFKEHLKAIEQS